MIKRDKISLILGIHCHQPVGNFGWVIEEAYEKCYRPFLEVLHQYPEIKFAAHYSGPLLEWIEENHPEFFPFVREMVERGQLEILGGGFYEPILMTIPEADRQQQIKTMNEYAEQKLGMHPNGIWLTERIWEPSLPKTLSKAGVKYTVADDSHFVQAGIDRSDVRGYYLTEDEGYSVAVLPIDQYLRYAIPFLLPPKIIQYLREKYDSGDRTCCSLLDDGEKFGVWPGTYELLYTKEFWLKRFFDTLMENRDWLELTTPSEYIERFPAEKLVYMPTASYFEMGQWTLGARDNMTLEDLKEDLKTKLDEKLEVFVRGGYFRNFFSRYPESNLMHKRMLQVSRKVHAADLEDEEYKQAIAALGSSQCNCAYWHGVFGGLYLPHLREAIYDNIIKAEKIADKRELAFDSEDIDKDGKEEIAIRNKQLAFFVSPLDGGTIFEIDHLPTDTNLGNTLARREEAYHHPEEKGEKDEKDVEIEGASIHELKREINEEDRKILHYDAYPRNCFRDHMFAPGQEISPESLIVNGMTEICDMAQTPFMPQVSESSDSIKLALRGETPFDGGSLEIKKTFTLAKDSSKISADYALSLKGIPEYDGILAIEFNLLMAAALGIPDPYTLNGQKNNEWRLIGWHSADKVSEVTLFDPHRKIEVKISSDRQASLAAFPVETISQSEAGFDRNYQGSSLWFHWPVKLTSENVLELSVELAIDIK